MPLRSPSFCGNSFSELRGKGGGGSRGWATLQWILFCALSLGAHKHIPEQVLAHLSDCHKDASLDETLPCLSEEAKEGCGNGLTCPLCAEIISLSTWNCAQALQYPLEERCSEPPGKPSVPSPTPALLWWPLRLWASVISWGRKHCLTFLLSLLLSRILLSLDITHSGAIHKCSGSGCGFLRVCIDVTPLICPSLYFCSLKAWKLLSFWHRMGTEDSRQVMDLNNQDQMYHKGKRVIAPHIFAFSNETPVPTCGN